MLSHVPALDTYGSALCANLCIQVLCLHYGPLLILSL